MVLMVIIIKIMWCSRALMLKWKKSSTDLVNYSDINLQDVRNMNY